MPAIRDGRGQLAIDDNEPRLAEGSGPVERRMASALQMADFAAERARMAEHDRRKPAAFTNTKAETTAAAHRGGEVRRQQLEAARAAQEGSVDQTKKEARRIESRDHLLAVMRTTSSYTEAAQVLDKAPNTLQVAISNLRRRGELPADVEELLKARNSATKAPAASDRNISTPDSTPAAEPSPATVALLEEAGLREPDDWGVADAALRAVGHLPEAEPPAEPAHIVSTESTIEAPEVPVPATDEAPEVAPPLATAEVATPPEPITESNPSAIQALDVKPTGSEHALPTHSGQFADRPLESIVRIQVALGAMRESEVPHSTPRIADRLFSERVLRALEAEQLVVIDQFDLEDLTAPTRQVAS